MRNLYESLFSVGKIDADITNKLIQTQIQDICDHMPDKGYIVSSYKDGSVYLEPDESQWGIYFDLAEFADKIRSSRIHMTDLYISLDKVKDSQLNIAFGSNMDFKGLNFRVVHDAWHMAQLTLTSDDSQKIYTLSNLNIYTSINKSGSLTGTFTTHTRNLKFKNCNISSKSVDMVYIKHDPLDIVDKDNNVTINSANFTFNIVPRYRDSRSILPSIFNKDRRDYIIDKIENDFLKDHDHYRKTSSEDVQSFLGDIKDDIDPDFWKKQGINVNCKYTYITLSYIDPDGKCFELGIFDMGPIGPEYVLRRMLKSRVRVKVNGIGNMYMGACLHNSITFA